MSFRVQRAESANELDALFEARHRIFVEEQRYSAPMPGGRLVDRWDAFPDTLNLMAVSDGEVIAGVRALTPAGAGIPADTFFDFSPHLAADARICAGSMLFVSPRFRGGARVAQALLGLLYVWARSEGCTHVIGVAAPVAEGLFFSQGYRAVAPRFFHHPTGLHATPVMLDLHAMAPKVARFVARHRFPLESERLERHFLAEGDTLAAPAAPHGYRVLEGRLSLGGAGIIPRELGPGDVWCTPAVEDATDGGPRATALTPVELAVVERRTVQVPRTGERRHLRSVSAG